VGTTASEGATGAASVIDFPQAGIGQVTVLPKSAAGKVNSFLQWGQWTRTDFWVDMLGIHMTDVSLANKLLYRLAH
jgi:hypothetical protein